MDSLQAARELRRALQTNTRQTTAKKAQPPEEDSGPTTKEVLDALLGVTQ